MHNLYILVRIPGEYRQDHLLNSPGQTNNLLLSNPILIQPHVLHFHLYKDKEAMGGFK